MPRYDIHVRCNQCGGIHPMRIRIHLDDGPVDKQSIAETFQGKAVPPQVLAIERHNTLCLRTGKVFKPESNDQIYLVPTFA